jgi:hypothetical protein
MDFGVMMFPTEYSIAPGELAALVEQRGYESLFFPEHTHIPASRRPPPPPSDCGHRGDGQPRHRRFETLRNHARARRGDAGHLDPGGRQLPRPLRRLRRDLVAPEAAAPAASTDPQPGARRPNSGSITSTG